MDYMPYQPYRPRDDVGGTAMSVMSDPLSQALNNMGPLYDGKLSGSLVGSSLAGVSGAVEASCCDSTWENTHPAPRHMVVGSSMSESLPVHVHEVPDEIDWSQIATNDEAQSHSLGLQINGYNLPTMELAHNIHTALVHALYTGRNPQMLVVPLPPAFVSKICTAVPPFQCERIPPRDPQVTLARPGVLGMQLPQVTNLISHSDPHLSIVFAMEGNSSTELSVGHSEIVEPDLDLEHLLSDSQPSSLEQTLPTTPNISLDELPFLIPEEYVPDTSQQVLSNDSIEYIDTLPNQLKRRFPCPYKPCTRGFASRKDLERHLATRRHRKDAASLEESVSRFNRYVCTVPWCKRRKEGFGRRDHFARHMQTMHPRIEVEDNV